MKRAGFVGQSVMQGQSLLVAAWVALACVACESTTRVGSGCSHGVCPSALTSGADSCLVTTLAEQVTISTLPGELGLSALCVAEQPPRNAVGDTNVHVYFGWPASSSARCTDYAFLKSVADPSHDMYARATGGGEICEVNQLSVTMGDGGVSVAAGEGFYYDDFSSDSMTRCTGSERAVQFTNGARPWDGVRVLVLATEKRDSQGKVNDALVCEAGPANVPVGTGCLPPRATPYESREVVLQTSSAACGGGVCIVYALEGDPSSSCNDHGQSDAQVTSQPVCASQEQIARRAFCTCRCDTPSGSAGACACPSGFSCHALTAELDPGLAGSYCVKNGTFTPDL